MKFSFHRRYKINTVINKEKYKQSINRGRQMRMFFNNIKENFEKIIPVSNSCAIKELDVTNAPIEFDFKQHRAKVKLSNKYYVEASKLYNRDIDFVVNNDYTFEKTFILNIEPLINEENILVHFQLNNYRYKNKRDVNTIILNKPEYLRNFGEYFISSPFGFTFKLNKIKFHITQVGTKIFIYSLKRMDEAEFIKYSDAIKTALGFLIGDFFGGDETIATMSGNVTKLGKITYAKSISRTDEKKLETEIFINRYASLKRYVEHFMPEDSITVLNTKQFEQFCETLLEEWTPKKEKDKLKENEIKENFVRTTLDYVAASCTKGIQIEQRLVFLACAFEALTKHFREDGDSIKLMDKKDFAKAQKDINSAITDIIRKYNYPEEKSEYIISKLQGKIQNEIPNSEKYELPFKRFGIVNENKEVFEKRNKMFHGDPFKFDKDIDISIREYQKDVWTYYYYIYVIILKMIGYEGLVVNIRRWNEICKYHNNAFNNIQVNAPWPNGTTKENKETYNTQIRDNERLYLANGYDTDFIIDLKKG